MRERWRAWSVGFALVAGACVGPSIDPEAHLTQSVETATWPVLLDGGVPLVDVHIDGQGPFLFKLDTGSGPSAVADQLAARLRLPTRRVQGTLTGANGEKRPFDRVADIASLALGEAVTWLDARAVVLTAEELDVHDAKRPVEGILGYALFADSTLVIDHPNKTLSVSRVPLPEPDDVEVFAMHIVNKTPRVRALLAGEQMQLLIDTGNDQGLVLDDALAARLPFVAPPVSGPMLATVSGMTRVRVGRLDGDLELGRHRVQQPMVSVMRSNHPMLGAELLRHFTVSLDARSGRVRFARTSERAVTVASRPTDGLGLRRAERGWQVIDVIPGSPAAEAGIIVGDSVRGIDYLGEGEYRVEVGQHGVYRDVLLRASVLVK